jgi:hypothetical protein
MTDITAFPTIRNVLYSGDNIQTFTATTAVTAGQVVAINATGESMEVDPSVATAGSRALGVALYSASAGAQVAVAMTGCICYVAIYDDAATIDAGDFVETNDCAVGGTVGTVVVAATGGATVTVHNDVVGIALDDIAASGTGRILIQPMCLTQPNTS